MTKITKIKKASAGFLAAVTLLLCAFPAGCRAEAQRGVAEIISDLVYTFRMNGVRSYSEVQDLLHELDEQNPALGRAWHRIMDCWLYVNTDLNTENDLLPDGLPQDDSLCLIVLGYRLNNDGSMAEELTGRLETALKNAAKYPEAYIAVTGGGTALINRNATEADRMAEWLMQHGVDESRIIVENRSQTTAENARFTNAIFEERYPQIRYAAVITSNYHLPLGYLLFTELFQLSAYLNNSEAVEVVAGAAFQEKSGLPEDLMLQGRDVWQMAAVLDEID